MKKKQLKYLSFFNLISGYVMASLFALLLWWDAQALRTEEFVAAAVITEDEVVELGFADDMVGREKDIIYIEGHPATVYKDYGVGRDRGAGIILDNDDDDVIVVRGDLDYDHVAVVRDIDDQSLFINRHNDLIIGGFDNETHTRTSIGGVGGPDAGGGISRLHGGSDDGDSGIALLDRTLKELGVDITQAPREVLSEAPRFGAEEEVDFGLDGDEFGNLRPVKDEGELELSRAERSLDDGYGLDKGELYAYNFPSQGVGAGIGTAGAGAGVGFAGIGAGVGEALLSGDTVPTLGGIGTYTPPPEGESAQGGPALAPPTVGGVGGLVNGAGAGAAAGLSIGKVKENLGLGAGEALGGANGAGSGNGPDCNFDHLPQDGALHIMMHVDGSGSILNARKQLEIMKNTLLKDALLPYYHNDEQLYNRRVTIVDGNGERTLQFFDLATHKDNVLALVFQDEAAPDYHLPNFNKYPEPSYLLDLNNLKSNLNGYGGVYRGIMFQVDRGRTHARAFKEFVECAWRGEGYLEKHNLRKYYWQDNKEHINHKDGIVFSDVYHAKDDSDPQYYLDLIFEASKKVGLDLNIYGGGSIDGKNIP